MRRVTILEKDYVFLTLDDMKDEEIMFHLNLTYKVGNNKRDILTNAILIPWDFYMSAKYPEDKLFNRNYVEGLELIDDCLPTFKIEDVKKDEQTS
jgi:hypothetical protein